MSQISNHTFDEISIGQTASYSKLIGEQEILLFAAASGDVNPVHLDAEYAAGTMFKERIAHGMLSGAIISAALALELPGPGTIYLGQSLRFRLPVKIGDEITVQLKVTGKRVDRGFVTLECNAINQHGKTVASGIAEVIAPGEKITIELPSLPRVNIEA
jgi:3-hydroxybutyryl-CoA dehydratase